mgnify:CR=1 FL=1
MLGLLTTGFSWLFGNSTSSDKAVGAISDRLDNAFYTDQEKAAASQKIFDLKIEYAKHTQNQSIARRVIAFIVSGLWGFIVLCAAIGGYFDNTKDSWAAYLMTLLDSTVNQPFMIILGFYFLAHVVGKIGKPS